MALILNIESSTTMCSVALGRDGECVALRELNEGYSHAEMLAPFVQEVLDEAKVEAHELDAIAVSKGPGSYTGLRIGVSLAKGLAFGLGKPLISVPTLQHMCLHPAVRKELNYLKDALMCPMLDARRMEVFTAVYDVGLVAVRDVHALILEPDSFEDLLAQEGIIFFGNGASKFNEIVSSPSAYFLEDVWPTASSMCPLAEQRFEQEQFEDVAYFEPFYLKDFMATTPKAKI